MRFRKRLLSCVELQWARRLYGAYAIVLYALYVAEAAGFLKGVADKVLGVWFLPALAAAAIARRKLLKIMGEEEAALALMELVSRNPYFCTAAELTVKAIALFGASLSAAVAAGLWFRNEMFGIVLSLTLFALLYSRATGRELKRLREELELVEKMKKAYEEVKL
jgi:tRNA U34 5-methylaminomethyl-2-thiouridine-forming methyltransferase MnmC